MHKAQLQQNFSYESEMQLLNEVNVFKSTLINEIFKALDINQMYQEVIMRQWQTGKRNVYSSFNDQV